MHDCSAFSTARAWTRAPFALVDLLDACSVYGPNSLQDHDHDMIASATLIAIAELADNWLSLAC